jgi:hypothetical protein
VLAVVAIPAAAAAQEPAVVTESFRVPTVDGGEVHVEVKRPEGVRAPVILHLLAVQRSLTSA